ncbi:carbohydrate kinase family protein [Salinicola acroporae]|uniref:Carbohydrate kinase n=1 Tax=Salinicola acroporae TaxID=1541440 RepID=A0ABT6I4R3_9GAMM|nr:carbohydrate kinase [Salinicola acroporae]MDH4572205.1 carbohydrate kinase [Salinicola acroporae]
MTPIIAFGEALVDMLSSRLGDDSGPETFTPYAGGAPANAAVACARQGIPSLFLGMIGDDRFGDFLVDELTRYGVDTQHVVRTREARTALAFVSRDGQGERRFDFYRPPAADLLYRREHLPPGIFTEPALVHLCSNSLTDAAIARTTLDLASIARRGGCLISVDVNLRAMLWPQGNVDIALVEQLLERAHLIKLSTEELDALRGDRSAEEWISARLAKGARLIVITDGPGPVTAHLADRQLQSVPPSVQAVDTTAAGDAFIGGLLASLSRAEVACETLGDWLADDTKLNDALAFACRCGAFAATRPGAFVSLPGTSDLHDLPS